MTYIKTAVIVLITAMLLSLVLTYASIMTIIQTSKSNTERILHSYITENSTYVFNSIKNGNDFIPAINAGYFTEKYLSDGTFDFDGTYLYNKNSEGGYVYKLSVPQVSFTVTNTLNLSCNYNIMIPIEFAGEKVSELTIPIKVKTSYNLK